ncbi:MAG TPA: phosphoadenylyl-sulfate reductase [Burkholderiaceae bacterium]|nr:phosphoadenylyl-sulfate reductase [Burkholderiaceae bacterium]
MTVSAHLDQLAAQAIERLTAAVAAHAPAVFTTSLGVEDMVVLELIQQASLDVDVVTFETGRLHEETLALLDRSREHYGRTIRALYPDRQALEAFVAEHGVNGFYQSIDVRKRCCEIRKTEPLARALAGKGLWITGLRREQSVTRASLQALEFDPAHGLMKSNPLIDWLADDVWAFARAHRVPTNVLHDRGFPSIGCAPCTRAVGPGEDPRAGRWWWEQAETRECGLHMTPDGRLVRARTAAV